MKKIALFFTIISFFIVSSAAAVAVNINSYYPLASGPKMPFPQFVNYNAGFTQTLYTLSDTNHQPAGVSHAEMEKWMRDAWQIDANRFTNNGTVNYQLAGGGAAAVNLIDYNSTCGDCSESAGYYLLSAALMGDKQTFDGIWFNLVENNRLMNAYKYSNGAWVSRGTGRDAEGLSFLSVYAPPGDSATDGDMDTAMAMLIAWKQWGDFTGYYAAGGQGPETNSNGLKAIKYKEMALASIRFLVALGRQNGQATDVNAWMSGDIDFDGYYKGGQSWTEVTNAVIPSGTGSTCGPVNGPFYAGPRPSSWYDYTGPSYLRCFANALTVNADPQDIASALTWCSGASTGNWNVNQFLRAAAASAWLQGQLNAYTFPVAGDYTVNGTTAVFNAAIDSEGEDFRSIWRNTLDYMLYGDPKNSWNPTTLSVVAGTGNTYEHAAATKVYNFLKNYANCLQPGTYSLHFGIPEMIADNYSTGGTPDGADHIPYLLGTASISILIAQDFPFMERWFRELCTLWDSDNNGTGVQTGYLTSSPKYFHDFFRLLGLMVLTGNYIDPMNFNPQANMKIYKAVSKTYAFPGDLVTYWLNFRNYASIDASNVVLTDNIPTGFTYVSATDFPGGSHVSGGSTVTWQLGTVPGLHTQNYATTAGGVTLVVSVNSSAPQGHYCSNATITCSNGTGWTSNEYPNEVSYIMKRNCVDIVQAALTITKTASVAWAKPADTITYTINYCNSSSAGWLNGGRPGVIFSIGAVNNFGNNEYASLVMRGMHSASEPWIDWGNYRLSYFLYGQGQGFNLQKNRVEGTTGITVTNETLEPGCTDMVNGTGCWDQRLIIQNAPSVSMPTHLLMKFFNNLPNMHYPDGILTYGGTGTLNPLLFQLDLWTNPAVATHDFTKDYSGLPYTGLYAYKDAGDNAPTCILYPIGPDYTDPDNPGLTVPKINRDSCDGTNPMISNVLIEEWDGYCWRRVYGTGPQPGREVDNVVITDSLPTNLNWGGFISTTPAGAYNSGTRTMTWNVGNMLVNQCGQVQYWVTAGGSCPSSTTLSAVNTAFIQATNEAPVADSAAVSISCSAPPPQLAPSSLTKTADKANYNTNDNITYTINYTNSAGSVANSATDGTILSSGANWTLDSGAANTYSAGGVVLPSSAGKSHYNYSNGINGEILASVNMTNNSSSFGVYFRNTMAFTIQVTGVGTSCPITIWNGTTAVATGSVSFASLNIDMRIDLTGPTVNVYIKDRSASSWNVLPTISYTTAPLTAGYVGTINGTPAGGAAYGGDTFIAWNTAMDTAFNVLFSDPLPGGISFTSAYNGGSTTITAGTIIWPVVSMMTAGQTASFSWVGSVTTTCTDIYNTAYVAPRGVTYTVGDRMSVHVNCGATTPTFTPTRTPTSTPTYSMTSTPSNTPTYTGTNTATNTATATFTYTATPTETPSATRTYTATNTSSPTPSQTPSLTVTNTVSSNTPTFTPTYTATPTASPTYTSTGTPTNTATYTPSDTATSTGTNTDTYTDTPSQTETVTSTKTVSSDTPTFTPSYTDTPTQSETWTSTATATDSPTYTYSNTPSNTATQSYTWTATETVTDSPTYTYSNTPSNTATQSYTWTATSSATQTLTYTDTPSQTDTKTYTQTATDTPTYTYTATVTCTDTVTSTPMPSPVNLDISLITTGAAPKVGATVSYRIHIENNTNETVNNIAIWDTLPAGMTYTGSPEVVKPTVAGNYLSWDLTIDPSTGNPYLLGPGQILDIQVDVVINSIDPASMPFTDVVGVDYNDPMYTPAVGKHPPLYSKDSFYPIGDPVVYPNPYNPDSGVPLIFDNVVPGSLIQIYTLSGERVAAIQAPAIKVTWDGKNTRGIIVSPGIYYFVIHNQTTGQAKKGKLFVIHGN